MGAPKGAEESHFRALWGNTWKCENYALVEAKSSFLRLEGVLRGLMCITLVPLVLSMRFGRHFLQKLCHFHSHWGPFECPFGALLAYFWASFSGSDFRSDFELLLVGAGGRGGVPVASESAESEWESAHARLPLRGCGEYLKASPLPPAPLVAGCAWLVALLLTGWFLVGCLQVVGWFGGCLLLVAGYCLVGWLVALPREP